MERKSPAVAYFYTATERRSRGVMWPSITPALTTALKDRKGGHNFAVDGDVEPILLKNGTHSYRITEKAIKEGYVQYEMTTTYLSSNEIYSRLSYYVYHDVPLKTFIGIPAGITAAFLIAGFCFVYPKDRERLRIRQKGRIIDGPELVSVADFNRRMNSDGIGFLHVRHSRLNPFAKPSIEMLHIPQRKEKEHFQILADTGQGKSVLIRQMLVQIRERDEAAIIYDPSREYIEQFYDPNRGDVILNPTDSRCPYWMPGYEFRTEAEALTVAASLFPEQGDRNQFFVDATRRIFARIIQSRPSPRELYRIMCDEREIENRLKGTELAVMIDRHAGNQRAGVLSSLNMAGAAIKLLPEREDTTQTWSALEWVQQRRGFIFVTAQKTEKKIIQQLHSMWLELLILQLQNEGYTTKDPVWLVLDEAADLKHLPLLQEALTQNRKSNCPIVLGFQGKDQVEQFYGRISKAMLSQPQTRIYFKTSEPEAAQWISKSLGDITIERLRETWTTGPDGKRTCSESVDPPKAEPLIPYSVITGLTELQGFLKHGNLIVKLSTQPENLPILCKGYIPRPIACVEEVVPATPPTTDVPAESQSGNAIFFE